MSTPVPFEEELRRDLPAEVLARVRYLPETGSTNADALAWADEGPPEGAVVVTDHQTAGRGRWGRRWESSAGKLLQFTVLVRPGLALDDAGLLSLAAGVAVCEGIEATQPSLACRVKWPNDVTIGGKKVSGMLIETLTSDERLDVAAVGIGINVGWTQEEIPAELQDSATSLLIESGSPVGRGMLLGNVLAALDSAFDAAQRHHEAILNAVRERSSVIGQDVVVRFADGSERTGHAVDIDSSGSLLVRTDDGVEPVRIAEVSRVRGPGHT